VCARANAHLQMKRSTVVASNGSSVLDNYRTSYGTFIK
jgi:prolyl 4-hydroxylase